MSISARSNERFPSISGKASCEFHAQQGIVCTPMDCEFFRAVPDYLSQYARPGKHAGPVVTVTPEEAAASEERAVQRAKEALSAPVKKNKRGKR